jgi:hypothetical protein
LSYTDSSVSSGKVYYYKVSAQGGVSGEGPKSGFVSGVTEGATDILSLYNANAPASYSVVVTSAALTSASTYAGVASDYPNLKATGTGTTGPAVLGWAESGETGTYNVLVKAGTVTKYQNSVSFTNGSAYLDWSTMLDASGGFVINGLPTGTSYTVYAVTGNPQNIAAAAGMIGSAAGSGNVELGSTLVVWGTMPLDGTYTLLLVPTNVPTTMYKATNLTITDGGGTASYSAFSPLQ